MDEPLRGALDRLSRVPGVRGALIVDAQTGVPVLTELTELVEGTAVAALASSLFQRSARSAVAADFGRLQMLQLEAEDGHVLATGSGELVVVVLAELDAQLGLVRLQARRALEDVA